MAREDVAALIPHQGGMCLWEHIVEWDDTRVVLETGSHRLLDNPLRANGKLRAVHLCEYGAQAMAVHGALKAAPERAPLPRNSSLGVDAHQLGFDRCLRHRRVRV